MPSVEELALKNLIQEAESLRGQSIQIHTIIGEEVELSLRPLYYDLLDKYRDALIKIFRIAPQLVINLRTQIEEELEIESAKIRIEIPTDIARHCRLLDQLESIKEVIIPKVFTDEQQRLF